MYKYPSGHSKMERNRQPFELALRTLVFLVLFMRPNFSIADEIRSNFSFLDENDYEMHLSLQADRSIRGEIISRGTGQRVATINGVNDTPGILRLSAIGTDTKFNFDDVVYRIRPAREEEKKNNAPVVDPVRVWDRADGKHSLTPFIACFKLCDKTYNSAYDEKSEHWGWSTNPEAAEFDTIASWSVEWDNFAVGWLILKGTTKNAKMAVEELSKTIHPTSFEKNADVFEIYVPPGLEDDALKILREKGVFKNNVTRGHYQRGTTTNLMAFKRGTFFAEKPSSVSYLEMLPAVKSTIRRRRETTESRGLWGFQALA